MRAWPIISTRTRNSATETVSELYGQLALFCGATYTALNLIQGLLLPVINSLCEAVVLSIVRCSVVANITHM